MSTIKNKIFRGITWDHPRGYDPLVAISEKYAAEKNIQVQWAKRSLKEFGDLPIEQLIDQFDLIILDHPYMGQADENKLLVPLDKALPAGFMAEQARQSVGPSFKSYRYNGNQYALPVDASAMMAASRPELVNSGHWNAPADLDELTASAKSFPAGKTMAMALCATDIWCVFLTLCAQFSEKEFFTADGLDEEVGMNAFDYLQKLKALMHPSSMRLNAIDLLDAMASGDEILYTPFVFGYSNYSRSGFRKALLHFANAPVKKNSRYTSLLGGAGIAVAAKSVHTTEALRFVEYLLEPALYSENYTSAGGQSAHLNDWHSETLNSLCNGFFRNTLATLAGAYVRPRLAGFNLFQEKAADLVHEAVDQSMPVSIAAKKLNKLYQLYCKPHVQTY
jgi:multiple sugar transport system substrate-binding protein